MKHLVIGTALIALLVACSDAEAPADNIAVAADSANATSAPVSSLPTGEEGMRRYAECSANLEAVSNLYAAIATQSQGAEKASMESDAAARRASALAYFNEAVRIAGTVPNRSAADVMRIKTEREAQLRTEEGNQEFTEFALMVGREADGCAGIAPPA